MDEVIVLGGAGAMGSMAVKDIALNESFSKITIADRNITAAQNIKEEINKANIAVVEIDVTDHVALVELLKNASIVINFVGPFYKFAPGIIKACIETKTNYVDICDDYDAAEMILTMNDQVKKAGISVLTGMGTSPGITNVLAKMGMDELDEVETVDTIWVMGEPEAGEAILYHVFHGGTGIVPGYDNGEKINLKPFTEEGALKVQFPEPLGEVKVYDVGHPEPVTIPHFYPDIKKVTNKGALLPVEVTKHFKQLFDLGFGSTTTIEVNGTNIAPRDFVVKYLQNNPQLLGANNNHGFGGLKVIVKGRKDGERTGFIYTTVSSESTAESVAIPAVVGAELIMQNKVIQKGVIAPEILQPIDIFNGMGKRKSVNQDAASSGLIIDMILPNGSLKSIKKGRNLTN